MKCPRCATPGMWRITQELSEDQAFWCITCNGYLIHQLRNGRLYIEFADWRASAQKEGRKETSN